MRQAHPLSKVMVLGENKLEYRFSLKLLQSRLGISGLPVWVESSRVAETEIKKARPSLAVSLDLNKQVATEEGYMIAHHKENGVDHIIISGGDIAGLVYGVRDFADAAVIKDNELLIETEWTAVAPALPHRLLWTWDHSTNWYTEQTGQQEIGAMNYYSKPAEGFLEDYKRVVDFASENKISGVTVYGFLRDNHGGVEAAKELAKYGKVRGVRIIPGVGINAYGGIYWEGNNKYNLSTWLADHPEFRAQFNNPPAFHIPEMPDLWFPTTSYTDASCPCKPETLAYHIEAIEWLTETFDIGGINFETGDYGTCSRPECTLERSPGVSWSLEDQGIVYPKLFEIARKTKPDTWLVSEVYWDNILDRAALSPLETLPDYAIYQYCFNRSYLSKLERELNAKVVQGLPNKTNILRTHMGSQWNKERYEFVADRFFRTAELAKITGLKGMTIFGEVSPTSTVNEINYLAFARFSYNKDLTWESFLADELSPRLGGKERTKRFIELTQKRDDVETKVLEEVASISRELVGEQHRRWIWLEDRLNRRFRMRRG